MQRYVFSEDFNCLPMKGGSKADPQVIGEALQNVAGAHKGRMHPQDVVDAAADPKHVLHGLFEWDDAAAGALYRLAQARTIIAAIKVTAPESGSGYVRAFVNVRDEGDSKPAYYPMDAVQSSARLRLAVLRRAEDDLASFERRYRDLGDVLDHVRTAKDAVRTRRETIARENEMHASV